MKFMITIKRAGKGAITVRQTSKALMINPDAKGGLVCAECNAAHKSAIFWLFPGAVNQLNQTVVVFN